MRRVLVTAAMMMVLGAGARAPFRVPGGDAAVLRMSWRLRGEREERCRTRSQQELDALPVHMRTPQVCEGGFVPYRLVVQVDNGPSDTLQLAPSGTRGDRPVFVLEERWLEVGERRVRLWLQRSDGAGEVTSVDTLVAAQPGAVVLVTIAGEGGGFVIRTRDRSRSARSE